VRSEAHDGTDVVVFAPLMEECAAFLKIAKPAWVEDEPNADLKFLMRPRELFEISGHVICPDAMGRTEAAIAVTKACILYRPRLVIVCGRAGGLRYWGNSARRLSIGDVIVTTKLVDLDIRKMTRYGIDDVRPRVPDLAGEELACAEEVAKSKWWRFLPENKKNPKAHFGSVISGNIILASETMQAEMAELLAEHAHFYRRPPIGIEMEGIGAAMAVLRLRNEQQFFDLRLIMIRGISDFADSHKNLDELHGRHLSSLSAASFAVSYLLRYFGCPGQPQKTVDLD